MKRFKNILFYSNGKMGSRIALNRAFDLAERNQGELTVVKVVEELPRELLRLAAAMPDHPNNAGENTNIILSWQDNSGVEQSTQHRL